MWNEYVWHRQTLQDLACVHRRSIRWIQSQLDQAPVTTSANVPQKIVAITDTTFFGRGYGILVVRCPRLKKNVHFHELSSETPEEYFKARCTLEKKGYVIEAVVVDGKRGVMRVFHDIPVQMCQFHQIAIVRRYLTCRPKLEAGKELRVITLTLPISTMQTFEKLLAVWYERWNTFLKERTYREDGMHWHYTHKRIRSAFRSIQFHLPYLFTYQRYSNLGIPNTTNSLDGSFRQLKHLLNVHCGMTPRRRYKLIQEILS